MLASGFDLLTYRKGRYPHIPRKRFQACRTRRDGRTITYVLADQEVRLLKGKLRLRQVTLLMDRSEEHTSELQSRLHLVCRLLLEKKKKKTHETHYATQT